MASQVTNYQCPACTGPLQFNPETGKLGCEFCGSVFELAEIEALYEEKEEQAVEAHEKAEADQAKQQSEWDLSGIREDWGADASGMKTYSCPACTAELICDATTAATACPYCGNPTVVPGQFSGSLKPDFVIPFKHNKDEAIKALKKHYQKRFFLPRSFTSQNHIQQIQGVYVPFWLFDAGANAHIRYKATRVRSWSDANYIYTETSFFSVTRGGTLAFEDVPVDGSSKMTDELLESIEPFDLSEAVDLQTAYLAGYLADKYDVESASGEERIRQRVETSMNDRVQSTFLGYATVLPTSRQIRIDHGNARYVLLPVWLLNTTYRGKTYTFAMNGQTGKMTGSFPICPKRTAAWFAGLWAISTALVSLIQLLL